MTVQQSTAKAAIAFFSDRWAASHASLADRDDGSLTALIGRLRKWVRWHRGPSAPEGGRDSGPESSVPAGRGS